MRHTEVINKISTLMAIFFPKLAPYFLALRQGEPPVCLPYIDLLILLPDSYTGHDFVRRRSEITDSLYDIEIDDGIRISPMVLIKSIWEKRKSVFSINVENEGIVI